MSWSRRGPDQRVIGAACAGAGRLGDFALLSKKRDDRNDHGMLVAEMAATATGGFGGSGWLPEPVWASGTPATFLDALEGYREGGHGCLLIPTGLTPSGCGLDPQSSKRSLAVRRDGNFG